MTFDKNIFTEKTAPIQHYLLELQNRICDAFETLEPRTKFIEDKWKSPLGEGSTRVLQNGSIFESAGVNISHVSGDSLPAAATQNRPELAGAPFEALGLSLVIHPRNPFIPTSHANIRFFIAQPQNTNNKEDQKPCWWFGGGMDLTPYYGFVEDCEHWHHTIQEACLPFGKDIYPRFKKWCDDYFFLKHRNEPRGIGGIFFDDLSEWDFETSFEFMQSVGDHYLKAYTPIISKRIEHPYGEKELAFQHYRRGRYVEFNLLYDRGTLFGLQSNGRTESILMSLPPQVNWKYNWKPEENSEEAKLYRDFLVHKDWLDVIT